EVGGRTFQRQRRAERDSGRWIQQRHIARQPCHVTLNHERGTAQRRRVRSEKLAEVALELLARAQREIDGRGRGRPRLVYQPQRQAGGLSRRIHHCEPRRNRAAQRQVGREKFRRAAVERLGVECRDFFLQHLHRRRRQIALAQDQQVAGERLREILEDVLQPPGEAGFGGERDFGRLRQSSGGVVQFERDYA